MWWKMWSHKISSQQQQPWHQQQWMNILQTHRMGVWCVTIFMACRSYCWDICFANNWKVLQKRIKSIIWNEGFTQKNLKMYEKTTTFKKQNRIYKRYPIQWVTQKKERQSMYQNDVMSKDVSREREKVKRNHHKSTRMPSSSYPHLPNHFHHHRFVSFLILSLLLSCICWSQIN